MFRDFFCLFINKEGNHIWLLLGAIASIIIWNAVSQKMLKSSKKKNKGKILTLMSAGTLSTLILTASLFQSITF
jgi:hypothetical protein